MRSGGEPSKNAMDGEDNTPAGVAGGLVVILRPAKASVKSSGSEDCVTGEVPLFGVTDGRQASTSNRTTNFKPKKSWREGKIRNSWTKKTKYVHI